MKKFTIPCDFGGKKAPFDVYIGEPDDGNHPLQYQAHWLATERGGTIPREVMDSFAKLLALSKKNNVSFEDLCVYALEAANEDKKKKDIKTAEEANLKGSLKSNLKKDDRSTFDKAKEDLEKFDKLIREGESTANNFNNRGFAYTRLEEYELARKDLEKALEMDPKLAFAYNNLGFVYLKLGEMEKSIDYLKKSAELDPTNSYVYRNLAHYYLNLKKDDLALKFLEKAKELNFHLFFGEEVNKLIEFIKNKK